MIDIGCTRADCQTKEWHKYHCPQCGKGLHSWEANGEFLGHCKACFYGTVAPKMSREAQQLFVLHRMAVKYGLLGIWKYDVVGMYMSFGFVAVARAMFDYA